MRVDEIRRTSADRFTLIFSDGSELKATLNAIEDNRVHCGMELDGAGYEALKRACSLALCKTHAMRLIGVQTLSKKGLRDKLVEKGEVPEDAETAVDWLESMGLMNDATFAGAVVRHYAAKGFGAARIKNELYRRGVPKELWDEAIGEMPEQSDKINKFIRSRLQDASDRAQIKKVTDGLRRRGYSWDEIKNALERFKEESGDNLWSEQ